MRRRCKALGEATVSPGDDTMDNSKLAETIDATAAWLGARDNSGAWKAVLTAEAERAILAFAARGVPSAP